MISQEEFAEKFGTDVLDRILLRDQKCLLCEESKTRDIAMVIHPVIPEELVLVGSSKNLENKFVLLCKTCAHKLEKMTHSPYKQILEDDCWDVPTEDLDKNSPSFSWLLKKGRRMSHMNRFAAEVTLRPENLAEHSYWVTLTALALFKDYVKKYAVDDYDDIVDSHSVQELLLSALYHDTSEIKVTDVPSPIKRASIGILEWFEQNERQAVVQLSEELEMPELVKYTTEFNREGYADTIIGEIVEMADRLCALVYCVEEVCVGNRNLKLAMDRIRRNLSKKYTDDSTPFWKKKAWLDVEDWISGLNL